MFLLRNTGRNDKIIVALLLIELILVFVGSFYTEMGLLSYGLLNTIFIANQISAVFTQNDWSKFIRPFGILLILFHIFVMLRLICLS